MRTRRFVGAVVAGLAWLVGCGGAGPQETTTPAVEERLPSPPQTTFDRIHALHYPFTIRCNVAHLREAWPDLVAQLHSNFHERDLEQAVSTLTTVVVATDANEKAVAFVGTTDEGIFELHYLADLSGDRVERQSVPGGVILWNREKPAPPDVRELLQLSAREMPEDALCEASFDEELVQRMRQNMPNDEEPAMGADAPTRLAWDLRFMQDWRGTWRETDGSFNADFDTSARATAAAGDFREVLEYARQQLGEFATAEPQFAQIVGLVSDILARTVVTSSHQRITFTMPVTIANLNEILTQIANLFVQQRGHNSSMMARMYLEQFSERVTAWSLSHPTAPRARHAPAFPVAARTAPNLTSITYDESSGQMRPPDNWNGGWTEYGITAPYGDHMEYEIAASGDEVTLHIYVDSDDDGIVAHYERTGHRNRADATIAWDEVRVTDEFE